MRAGWAKAGVAAIALMALWGCGAGPVGPIRDRSVPIASLAVFDPARMAGDWHVVAAYGGEAACGPLTESWVPAGEGVFAVTGQACRAGAPAALRTEARLSGPGRFARQGPAGPESLWLLWVDAGNRVAVVGTPDGSFGRILSREPALRGDLMQAARDVLAFNGYDLARLVPAGR